MKHPPVAFVGAGVPISRWARGVEDVDPEIGIPG